MEKSNSYIIGFFSALLQGYYGTVMFDFIRSKIFNPAYNGKIEISIIPQFLGQVIIDIPYSLMKISEKKFV